MRQRSLGAIHRDRARRGTRRGSARAQPSPFNVCVWRDFLIKSPRVWTKGRCVARSCMVGAACWRERVFVHRAPLLVASEIRGSRAAKRNASLASFGDADRRRVLPSFFPEAIQECIEVAFDPAAGGWSQAANGISRSVLHSEAAVFRPSKQPNTGARSRRRTLPLKN